MPLHEIDRQLIDRCLQRDIGAWSDFVDRYIGLIYHVISHVSHARAYSVSPSDMEDIASEIFLKLVEEDSKVLRNFQGKCSLPAYLTIIARRRAIKVIVRKQREQKLDQAAGQQESLNGDRRMPPNHEPIAAAEEVDRMLARLDDREAEVVRLYHFNYLTYRQIGKRLGIPENSVGPILAKARAQLRRQADA